MFTAVVPNHFGTRDRFRGRQFFLKPEGDGFGMSQEHFISVIITSVPPQIISRFQSPGTSDVLYAEQTFASFILHYKFLCLPIHYEDS